MPVPMGAGNVGLIIAVLSYVFDIGVVHLTTLKQYLLARPMPVPGSCYDYAELPLTSKTGQKVLATPLTTHYVHTSPKTPLNASAQHAAHAGFR